MSLEAVPFQVESVILDGDIRLIGVRGELDLGTASAFEKALDDAIATPGARIVVDMSDCGFVDSTGIALIINAWRAVEGAEGASGRLVLCSANEQVGRLFEVTGLQGAIAIEADREGALKAIAR